MQDFLSPAAATVLLGDSRQCIAKTRDGQRCKNAPALGQWICHMHGAKSPLAIAAARERLLMLVEPALDALLRALKTAPPCEHCGRSDADRDPAVIRAAQIVLDRCGLGAHSTLELLAPSNPLSALSFLELADRAEQIAIEARRLADNEAAQIDAEDGVVVEDGSVVDDEREL